MESEKRQREIAKEVSYERTMLCWTCGMLCRQTGGNDEVVGEDGTPFLSVTHFVGTSSADEDGSALLEAFLLHVRNLRDFLYDDQPTQDDVVAAHFFDRPDEWRRNRPPLGEYVKSIRKRLNKALAHISYARLDYRKDKKWSIGRIKRELDAAWEAFIEGLPREKRPWFQ